MSQYRYINNSPINVVSSGYSVPAWGFLQANNLVLPLDTFVTNGLELTIDNKNQPLYKNLRSFTIPIVSSYMMIIKEGDCITLKSSSTGVGSWQKADTSGAPTGTVTNIAANSTVQIGPFLGSQKIIIVCTAGSMDATLGDAVLGASQVAKDANGNIIGLTNGDATLGVAIGPYAFANLPSAVTYAGYRAKVSDVGGAGGSLWVSNSTRWCPENGRVTLGSLAARATTVGVTETIVKQWLIPAGVIQNFDRFRLRATMSKSGTAETVAFAMRFGPLGTVADTQIFSNSNMATTNVSMGVDTEFKRLSATTILRSGVGSIGSSYNAVSTAAFASAITVANMDTSPMYLSVTLRSAATGAETIALEDAIYDLLGYVP